MLLRLKVKNFLSFYEETVFDMFPNLKKTMFPHHIYADKEIPLLKQAAIYGANGSGKSNLLLAIGLLKRIATNKDTLKDYPIKLNKFRLAELDNKAPISLSVEFYCNGKYFIFTIEFDENNIIKEELLISLLGKNENEVIYIREGNKVEPMSSKSPEISHATGVLLKNNPLSSLLPLIKEFPVFEDDRANTARNWFEEYLRILSLRRVNPSLISRLSKDIHLLDFTKSIFEEIGLGIKKVGVEENKISDILGDDNEEANAVRSKIENGKGFARVQNGKVVVCFETNDKGEEVAKRLYFTHLGLNGYESDMEIESESDGTAKVLNLIPAFYEIKHKECVYFIDEIENSIHPSLVINLIKFLSNADTKGQLIFTTHETELLNQQEIMRPDEVWFTEKVEGSSKIYSLNDFKLHNTINIKNGYMEGRYGAIPFIGELNF